MKQSWQKIALKIDALSLRERVIVFAMAALLLIMLINTALLDPQFAKQHQLSQRIKQEQAQIAGIQAQIQQKVKQQEGDPDRDDRERLQKLKQQAAQMNASLQDMQKGLVSPDKMPDLLDGILKQSAGLRLVSLKSLPVTSLNEPIAVEGKPSAERNSVPAAVSESGKREAAADGIFKHGVEIVVQGGYLDMMHYMASLQETPWQLFWGKAELSVDEYPKSTLKLTLFTLSLDKRWLNL